MDWLNAHTYLAIWLAPVAAIVGAMLQTKGVPKIADVNWWQLLLYVSFFICLGATFSQSLDHDSRVFARTMAGMAFGVMVVSKLFVRRDLNRLRLFFAILNRRMKTCLVSVQGEHGEGNTVEVNASSLFDAAHQAMQKWAMFWWYRPELIIEVNSGAQKWRVSGIRVKAWREAKSIREEMVRRKRG